MAFDWKVLHIAVLNKRLVYFYNFVTNFDVSGAYNI